MGKNKFDGVYEEFADKFYKLCEDYAMEDFDGEQVKKICNKIIDEFAI